MMLIYTTGMYSVVHLSHVYTYYIFHVSMDLVRWRVCFALVVSSAMAWHGIALPILLTALRLHSDVLSLCRSFMTTELMSL